MMDREMTQFAIIGIGMHGPGGKLDGCLFKSLKYYKCLHTVVIWKSGGNLDNRKITSKADLA